MRKVPRVVPDCFAPTLHPIALLPHCTRLLSPRVAPDCFSPALPVVHAAVAAIKLPPLHCVPRCIGLPSQDSALANCQCQRSVVPCPWLSGLQRPHGGLDGGAAKPGVRHHCHAADPGRPSPLLPRRLASLCASLFLHPRLHHPARRAVAIVVLLIPAVPPVADPPAGFHRRNRHCRCLPPECLCSAVGRSMACTGR